jgi:hypothetical protein
VVLKKLRGSIIELRNHNKVICWNYPIVSALCDIFNLDDIATDFVFLQTLILWRFILYSVVYEKNKWCVSKWLSSEILDWSESLDGQKPRVARLFSDNFKKELIFNSYQYLNKTARYWIHHLIWTWLTTAVRH